MDPNYLGTQRNVVFVKNNAHIVTPFLAIQPHIGYDLRQIVVRNLKMNVRRMARRAIQTLDFYQSVLTN